MSCAFSFKTNLKKHISFSYKNSTGISKNNKTSSSIFSQADTSTTDIVPVLRISAYMR